jgi:hypothetical protein
MAFFGGILSRHSIHRLLLKTHQIPLACRPLLRSPESLPDKTGWFSGFDTDQCTISAESNFLFSGKIAIVICQ